MHLRKNALLVDRKTPSLSVIVPVYNSELSLPELCERLSRVLPDISNRYELIMVNDCSRDKSWDIISKLAMDHSWIRGINLMRNYGQHNAVLCGIRAAKGDLAVTMDDDLQHPPEEIPSLLEKLGDQYDVVYGIPVDMPHSLWRNIFSRFSKWSMSRAMGINTIRDISAFRVFRTNLRNAFESYQSPNLLFDVLLSWGTTRFAAVSVRHEARKQGESNYTFLKLFNQATLMLTGFSTMPLRLASLVGFGFAVFGAFVLLYVVILSLTAGSVPGFPFLASIVSIFSGAQLFALGIMGEYVSRIFNRSTERPTYVVNEVIESVSSDQQMSRRQPQPVRLTI